MSDWFEKRQIERKAAFARRRRRDKFIILGLLVVAAGAFLVNKTVGEGGSGEQPTRTAVTASPSPTANPLEQAQLKGLATSVAERYYGGDAEVAAAMITHAEQLTGCDLQGYTGGRGGASLADPAERDFIRRDAAEKGWAIAFGHSGKQWIVVSMVCPE